MTEMAIAVMSCGGIVVVGLIGLYGHFVLRKEKFKELLYRERFFAYKEIAEIGFITHTSHLHALTDHKKIEQFAKNSLRLNESLYKFSLFISPSVGRKMNKFRLEMLSRMEDFLGSEKELQEFFLKDSYAKTLDERWMAVINEMRKELGIDVLTESLTKTYK
jgi:hypothetical protein